MDETARHVRLLTETIAAVNSTLDLGELFDLVARKVADALEADACFVYLYDDAADELAASDLVRRAFGRHIFDRYVELKRKEWDDYRVQLTPWEMEKYLGVL